MTQITYDVKKLHPAFNSQVDRRENDTNTTNTFRKAVIRKIIMLTKFPKQKITMRP